jgi:hypothetical protein
MLFYGYMVVALALGVMSNFVKVRWTLLASALVISAGILIDAWRYIDVAKWGIWRTISETLGSAAILHIVPTALFFGVPFFVGKYGYQLVAKVVLRSARG